VTVLRLPLAAAFVLDEDPWHRFAILAVAGATDVLDGVVARRFGGSRAGPVLDPVVDKLFTVTAILAVVTTRVGETLSGWEFAGVMLRDLAVLGGFVAAAWLRRRVTIPARISGKVVTVMQFATLTAILLEWHHVRHLAWTTAVVSLWAVIDYARIGVRQLRGSGQG
jgi:phosphatidylglycerophosphate synthase